MKPENTLLRADFADTAEPSSPKPRLIDQVRDRTRALHYRVRLRVKNVEFERREIVVRDGKGQKDRVRR